MAKGDDAGTGPTDVEGYLVRIGTWNKFPLIIYFIVITAQVLVAFQWLSSAFINLEPPHRCRIPGLDNLEKAPNRSELLEWIPLKKDPKTGEVDLSSCKRYKELGTNETEACGDGWFYDPDYGFTAVVQWDLVCEQKEINKRMTLVFFMGVLFGCLLLPTLSDYFGRKKVMLIYLFLSLPFGVGAAFANSWITLAAIKFFIAFFISGGVMCMYILVCELFPSSHRAFAGNAIWFAWTVGYMGLPWLSYGLRTWWHLQLAITLPLLPLLIAYIPLVPESIHYLLNKGRVGEAEDILRKGAKLNGMSDMEVVLLTSEETGNDNKGGGSPKQGSLLDVLRARHFNIMALLQCFVWAVNSMVYYGISLNTSKLAGDRYMNFFISGAVEIPAYIACIVLMKYIDRRKPCCAFHVIAGVSLFILLFIPYKTESGVDLTSLHTTLTMIGKFGITASFGAIYLQTMELYPTVVRNAGLGLSSTFARVGTLVAPYINLLAEDSKIVEPIIFGLLALVAAVVVLSFPETKYRHLPNTMEDVSKPWFDWFGFRPIKGASNNYEMNEVYENEAADTRNGEANNDRRGEDGVKGTNISYISAC